MFHQLHVGSVLISVGSIGLMRGVSIFYDAPSLFTNLCPAVLSPPISERTPLSLLSFPQPKSRDLKSLFSRSLRSSTVLKRTKRASGRGFPIVFLFCYSPSGQLLYDPHWTPCCQLATDTEPHVVWQTEFPNASREV